MAGNVYYVKDNKLGVGELSGETISALAAGTEIRYRGPVLDAPWGEGDEIKIVTTTGVYDVILIQHPEDSEKGYLGVVFPQSQSVLFGLGSPFFNPYLNVETEYDENILHFIENFFVWLILIFFMIALFNMLPLGFLDGGKFLYIFALALTKSQKKATKIFRVFSSLIILIFFVIMFVWIINLN